MVGEISINSEHAKWTTDNDEMRNRDWESICWTKKYWLSLSSNERDHFHCMDKNSIILSPRLWLLKHQIHPAFFLCLQNNIFFLFRAKASLFDVCITILKHIPKLFQYIVCHVNWSKFVPKTEYYVCIIWLNELRPNINHANHAQAQSEMIWV